MPDGGTIGVYDFGGGTYDTAVLLRRGVGFELAGSPGGDVALGGEDLDVAFMEILAEHAEALDPTLDELWEAEGRVAERHRTLLRRDITRPRRRSAPAGVHLWVPGYDDENPGDAPEYERAVEPLSAPARRAAGHLAGAGPRRRAGRRLPDRQHQPNPADQHAAGPPAGHVPGSATTRRRWSCSGRSPRCRGR